MPFGELIDHLGGARDAARNPVYQVMFNYLDFSLDDLEIEGLQVEGWRASAGTAMLDLSLDVTEQSDGGYLLCLEASTDLFDPDHVRRMLEHYLGLLQAGLARPPATSGSWGSSPPPSGRRSPRWRGGRRCRRRRPRSSCRSPSWSPSARSAGAIGWRCGPSSGRSAIASWCQPFQAVGEGLQRQGVVAGELVLVGAGDDPCDTLILILGVMAAGAAYVPLDSASPPARQQAVQADCGARWLLVGAGFDDRWQPPGLRVLAFDPARPGWPDSAPAVAPSQLSRLPLSPLDRPAYLMYTSGSTGTPKGVLISQRNLVHQCRARLHRFDDAPGILLGTYSFAFDSSLAGISHTLCAGGTLRFAGERLRRDPAGLCRLIAGEGITHLDMVPSAYAGLLAESTAEDLRSLRVVICGGESLPAELAQRHFQLAPHARLYNEYGPTEATVFATVHELAAGEAGRPSIGKPVGDTSCWLLGCPGTAGAAGARGRAVHRRRRSGPGLSRPTGGQRPGVRAAPAGWRRRAAAVPHRRSGAPAPRRCPGPERPARRSGAAAWSPGGAGRGGGGAAPGARRERRGGGVAIGCRDAAPAGRLLRPRPVGGHLGGVHPQAAVGPAAVYMVPAVLVPVPALRRTSRGKLDRESLPRPARAPPAPLSTKTRAPPPRCAWPACGSGCWARTASAGPTTSLRSAVTRCWP